MEYKEIVIRCPNWLGDAVMATPVFPEVKKLFPNAHCIALASDPIAELLQGVPGIDEFLTFSREKEKKRAEEQRMAAVLKHRSSDLGILLTRSFSSAWMMWRAQIPHRIGYNDHFRRFLLTNPLPLPKKEQHDVFSYLDLLTPFGEVEKNPELHLCVTESEKKNARTLLESYGVSAGQKLLLINPGAAYGSAKCWPKASFCAVINALPKEVAAICIGNTKDSSNGLPEKIIDLTQKTSLRSLIALISISDAILTNDSGPMHIAAALKKNLVALFGSTNPKRTGPWNTGKVLYKDVECSPCYKRECPIDFRCMTRITPKEVLEALELC